jgi:hypothetical protein
VPNVIPVNGHDEEVRTKHESLSKHLIVIPVKTGIQKNGLDTGFRRYDGVDFHTKPEIQASSPASAGWCPVPAPDLIRDSPG